jgi:hypothetical protein
VYCFLSHAQADANDRYFDAFVADFTEELRGRVGAPTSEQLVFRASSSIPLGAEWQSSVDRALLACRTFLAIVSPTYLRQPACGAEWARFEWRLRTLGGAAPPDLLLPLVWIPIPAGDLPAAVRRRQLAHATLGPAYAARGLRHVVQRAGAAYRDLLAALADRVRDLVRLPALPSAPDLVPPGRLLDPFEIATGTPPIPSDLPSHAVASAPASAIPAIPAMNLQPPLPIERRHVILFVAANPSGTTRLALDDECAAIERELGMTAGRGDFEFRSKWAVSIDELMRHLNELQPTIVHFSGHGGSGQVRVAGCERSPVGRDVEAAAPGGIQLQDEQRQPQHVTARALTRMIESAAPSVRLVILNACFSDAVASELRRVVDCVVGMRGAIGEPAAHSFAVGFYRALGHRRSVGNAVAQAVAGLAARQLPDEHLPICITRDGIDADRVAFLGKGISAS